ncbi:MAG: response regulator transcription factor [Muribaculaceae bacterium]|nr:response regulator transcription factor [Roseburia sp.]MCM1430028.1 response regulator transcription factor [Muribaculaceae bacterium]MCM1492945.1 response regulator transcription factor [Muribaculaceae bacterium]
MEQQLILVADDDKEIVFSIAKLLEYEGFQIIRAYNGIEALERLEQQNVDLILLDVMMPKLDGIETLMKIREKSHIPVIILSAKTQDRDKVYGLVSGADDYISKPYNPSELIARVKALLRRYRAWSEEKTQEKVQENVIVNGNIKLMLENKTVVVDGEEKHLTATEYKILYLLMSNMGRVFSAEEIYERIWNEDSDYMVENTVMVHIRRIREKIEVVPRKPKYLKVVWGIGYKMEKY